MYNLQRCRSSRGENLNCMNSTISHAMEMNGCGKGQRSGREHWGKIPEQHNGHNHQVWYLFNITFFNSTDNSIPIIKLNTKCNKPLYFNSFKHRQVQHPAEKIKIHQVILVAVHRLRRKMVKIAQKLYRKVLDTSSEQMVHRQRHHYQMDSYNKM